MPINHDNQNMATKSGYMLKVKKNHVCMYGLYHGNPASRVLTFLVGFGLSIRGAGGHTCKGNFE